MITVKDIQKSTEHPSACKDKLGRLRVGAAIGVGEGTEERAAALIEAGADVVVVDTAHGHAQGVLDRVKWVKKTFPKAQVIGGNIATANAAKALVDHALTRQFGIGPGPSARPIFAVVGCRNQLGANLPKRLAKSVFR